MFARSLIFHILVSLPLLAACSGEDSIDVGDGNAINADIEALAGTGVTSGAALSDYRILVSGAEAMTRMDLVEPDLELGETADIRDAVDWSDGRILVLTDQELLVWDGALRPSPMEEVMSGADIADIDVRGDELWIAHSTGLHIWTDGWLSEIAIPDEPLSAPIAAAPSMVWASVETGVVAFAAEGDSWTAVERRTTDIAPNAMAVDAAGSVWVAADGRIHRRDSTGEWTVFAFPAPVTHVAGSRTAPRVWVATESGVYSGVDGEFNAVTGVSNTVADWSVDDAGRLVMIDGASLSRASVGRPIAVRGLPTGGQLLATADLWIGPTVMDSVSSVSATLGGTPLQVEDLGHIWRAIMEPEGLTSGDHDLVVDITYGDTTSTLSSGLSISNPTWETDILPIYSTRCSQCHNGATGTATLDNPESWIERFDNIVERVTTNNMPLGLEPLSEELKGTIRAWGAKGFPLN